jgi:hypothetical protein
MHAYDATCTHVTELVEFEVRCSHLETYPTLLSLLSLILFLLYLFFFPES